MAGHQLSRRIAALEGVAGANTRPWRRVLVERGKTEAEAIGAYEEQHGPIGDDNVILRWIVAPGDDQSKIPAVGMRH